MTTPVFAQGSSKETSCFRNGYPKDVEDNEQELVYSRWKKASLSIPRPGKRAVDETIGLALSGGGIRSATFCLGVLQALGRNNQLREIDYLSTVSGGGYVGSFLGRLFCRPNESVESVEAKVASPHSDELRWLREHGRYVIPTGGGDILTAAAHVVRSWIALHFNVIPVIFGLFCMLGALRALFWDYARIHLADPVFLGIWWSPWIILPGLFALLWAIPLGTAFWLSQALERRPAPDKNGRYFRFTWIVSVLLLAGAVALWKKHIGVAGFQISVGGVLALVAVLLLAVPAWFNRGPMALAVITTALLAIAALVLDKRWLMLLCVIPLGSICIYRVFYNIAAHRIGKGGLTRTEETAIVDNKVKAAQAIRSKTRNLLTMALGKALLLVGALLLLALVDTLGQVFYLWYQMNENRAAAIGGFGGFFTAIALLHKFSDKLLSPEAGGGKSALKGIMIPLAALVLGILYLSIPAFAAQALLWSNKFPDHVPTAYIQTSLEESKIGEPAGVLPSIGLGVSLLIIWVLRRNLAFLNLSSYHQLYSSRLARAYFGASNPKRRHPDGKRISELISGDDCTMEEYTPHHFGGPLHLINVTINETVSGESQVEQRDRKGLSMAIGPKTISVRVRHHNFTTHTQEHLQIQPLHQIDPDTGRQKFHVYGKMNKADAEPLRLSNWVGISGAAFSTGSGAHTTLSLSLLTGLANVRLGYWWRSGFDPKQGSDDEVSRGRAANLITDIRTAFPLLTHLVHEFTGQFHGTAQRNWYLSDGGHFENTGCYELLRRRVPLMILCDCGADDEYRFEDLANLVRKARIDYDAEITFLDDVAIKQIVTNAPYKPGEEPYSEINSLYRKAAPASKGFADGLYSTKHCAIAKVRYDVSRRGIGAISDFDSLILIIKPSLTGDEPLDLLQYHFQNKAFPQEPTSDQFFDEAQWESYRRLGDHIGSTLFAKEEKLLQRLFETVTAQRSNQPTPA